MSSSPNPEGVLPPPTAAGVSTPVTVASAWPARLTEREPQPTAGGVSAEVRETEGSKRGAETRGKHFALKFPPLCGAL